MTDKRRIENIVGITDTLWQLNKRVVLDSFEARCGHPVPEECIPLIEQSFRIGAAFMEKAIGRKEPA